MRRNRRTERDFFEDKKDEYEEDLINDYEEKETGSFKKILAFIILIIILLVLSLIHI